MNITHIILLLGGVALFLFGMSLMGDGLKKVAGSRLELILYKLSGTTLKGILLGTGVTAVIQSSSATSVMVVGFVNSEMMKVRQAISVIMGAVIGTSITGWIICLSELGGDGAGALSLLSTEVLSSVIAIIGIIMSMVGKKKTTRDIGSILLGFAVLMFGMKTMSSSVSGLKENPTFIKLMTDFSNPFLGILIGLVFTAVLQSASATVGILQALSITGAITVEIAVPIIMGIAIGASVPVLISSVGATTNGKRAALSYLVIDIIMVLIFAILFYGLNALIGFSFMGTVTDSVKIALINTVFRASTIILLIPFVSLIEKIVTLLIKPTEDEDRESKAMDRLEERFLAYPPLAVEQARLAIKAMAGNVKQGYFAAIKLMHEYTETGFHKVVKLEAVVDKYEDRIGRYLTKLTGHDLADNQSQAVGDYLHAITDFERISDLSLNIAESFKEMKEKNIIFSMGGNHEIAVLSKAVGEMLSTSVKAFEDNNMELAYMAEALEEVIDDLCDEIKIHHIERLKKEECTLQKGYILNDLLTNYERIGDQCANLVVAMIVQDQHLIGRHEFSEQMKMEKAEKLIVYEAEYREKYQLKN